MRLSFMEFATYTNNNNEILTDEVLDIKITITICWSIGLVRLIYTVITASLYILINKN